MRFIHLQVTFSLPSALILLSFLPLHSPLFHAAIKVQLRGREAAFRKDGSNGIQHYYNNGNRSAAYHWRPDHLTLCTDTSFMQATALVCLEGEELQKSDKEGKGGTKEEVM